MSGIAGLPNFDPTSGGGIDSILAQNGANRDGAQGLGASGLPNFDPTSGGGINSVLGQNGVNPAVFGGATDKANSTNALNSVAQNLFGNAGQANGTPDSISQLQQLIANYAKQNPSLFGGAQPQSAATANPMANQATGAADQTKAGGNGNDVAASLQQLQKMISDLAQTLSNSGGGAQRAQTAEPSAAKGAGETPQAAQPWQAQAGGAADSTGKAVKNIETLLEKLITKLDGKDVSTNQQNAGNPLAKVQQQ